MRSKPVIVMLLLVLSSFAVFTFPSTYAASPDTITKICETSGLSGVQPSSGSLTLHCNGMLAGDTILVGMPCAGTNTTLGVPSDGLLTSVTDNSSTDFHSGGAHYESTPISDYIKSVQYAQEGTGIFSWYAGALGVNANFDQITVSSAGVMYGASGGGIGNGCGTFIEYFSVPFTSILKTAQYGPLSFHTDGSPTLTDTIGTEDQVLDVGPIVTGVNTNAFTGCSESTSSLDSSRTSIGFGGQGYYYNTDGFFGSLHDTLAVTTSQTTGNYCAVFTYFAQIETPPSSSIFTCSITNMDAGNYVVAGINKFYNLYCIVQSNAVYSTNYPINDVKIQFNDSANTYVFEYDNATGAASIDSGGTIATLGSPSVVSSYDAGIRTMNLTLPFSLNQNAIDSDNRTLYLYAQTGGNVSRGFQAVQTDYFNIYSKGGTMNFLLDGDCSIPAGADTFQTICQYGSNAHNWIAENSTYYDLQQYQGQFAIQLSRASNGLDESAFWQNYANSGSGTNPSSNKGDWQIDSGFYYYDNTTSQWIKGINVKLEMVQGRVGSTNLWTEFQAAWYNGNALVANQTLYAFVPNDSNGSAVNIWLNFWYSQNNASTTQGGQVSAYYTGMHSTDYLLWNSWSPFLGNSTQSQVFMPILNGDGDTISVQNTQFTRVFMNMSRPGAPNIHTNQPNFQVQTNNFQEQEFNVGTGTISGITTPTFTAAIVPTISSGSIFSPIINALKALADDIGKVFLALGNVVWAGLASRFPWFTSFWDSVGAGIVSFASLMLKIFTYVLDGLTLVSIALRYVGYPFEIISGAVGWIEGLFSWLGPFSGQSAQEFVVIIVVLYFVGDIMSAAERGDTAHFISLAQGAWRILDTIMWWTYLFVDFIIKTIEGLIP